MTLALKKWERKKMKETFGIICLSITDDNISFFENVKSQYDFFCVLVVSR